MIGVQNGKPSKVKDDCPSATGNATSEFLESRLFILPVLLESMLFLLPVLLSPFFPERMQGLYYMQYTPFQWL